jgi:hypothetical protein
MSPQLFLFLLVCFFFLSLALLWQQGWLLLRPSPSPRRAKPSRAHRLLKPRTRLDCPDSRHSGNPSSLVEPPPAQVHPWRERKCRRGAPKRVNTEGFACHNQQCPYFGIKEAQIHAPLWSWPAWPGRAQARPGEVSPATSRAVLDVTLPCIG